MHMQRFLLLAVAVLLADATAILEEERLHEYAKRQYAWPPPKAVPDTSGWTKIMSRRLRQVEQLPDDDHKYDAWITWTSQALIVRNFTTFGWGVTRAPTDLVRDLQLALQQGMPSAKPEGQDLAIVYDGENNQQLMVELDEELLDRALDELRPYMEAWAGGVSLEPHSAYGLRVYKNTSRLYMHLDEYATHVISGILHVDHSDGDGEPWPLVIEDFDGTTQSVYLEKGDLLFYESAKCLHGRPVPLNGKWYSSLFLHYAPVGWPETIANEPDYAIPSHWREQFETDVDRLQMVDTAMIEPDCSPYSWCLLLDGTNSNNSRDFKTGSWTGPATEGMVSTARGVQYPLDVKNLVAEEL